MYKAGGFQSSFFICVYFKRIFGEGKTDWCGYVKLWERGCGRGDRLVIGSQRAELYGAKPFCGYFIS